MQSVDDLQLEFCENLHAVVDPRRTLDSHASFQFVVNDRVDTGRTDASQVNWDPVRCFEVYSFHHSFA